MARRVAMKKHIEDAHPFPSPGHLHDGDNIVKVSAMLNMVKLTDNADSGLSVVMFTVGKQTTRAGCVFAIPVNCMRACCSLAFSCVAWRMAAMKALSGRVNVSVLAAEWQRHKAWHRVMVKQHNGAYGGQCDEYDFESRQRHGVGTLLLRLVSAISYLYA